MASRRDIAEIREIRRSLAQHTEDYDPDVRLVALCGAVWDIINASDTPSATLEAVVYMLRTGGRCGATEETEAEYVNNHPYTDI